MQDVLRVQVGLEDGFVIAPRLVLACDGIDSGVRTTLSAWSDDAASFEPVVLPSPSGGLLYKMLLVPPSFEVRNMSLAYGKPALEKPIRTEPQQAYTIPSALTARTP